MESEAVSTKVSTTRYSLTCSPKSTSKGSKEVVIDEDPPPEENESIAVNLDINSFRLPVPVENGCPNCENFRSNADQAWDLLQKFSTSNERIKKLENENDQLNRIRDENKDYIETMRQQFEQIQIFLRQKDDELRERDERIANLNEQYNMVLKAGTEAKKSFDQLNSTTKQYEKLKEDYLNLQDKLDKSLQREKSIHSKLKKAIERLAREREIQEAKTKKINRESASIPEFEPMNAASETEASQENQEGFAEIPFEFESVQETSTTHQEIEPSQYQEFDEPITAISETEGSQEIQQELLTDKSEAPVELKSVQETSTTTPEIEPSQSQENETLNSILGTEDSHEIQEEFTETPVEIVSVQEASATTQEVEPSQNQETEVIKTQAIKETCEEEDDLFLELPPSPPPPIDTGETFNVEPGNTDSGKEKISREYVIDSIFKSRFFIEMEKMPLLEDIGNFQMSPEPEPQSSQENLVQEQEPEKIDVNLQQPASLAINEIKNKYKVDKRQATLLYSKAKREYAMKHFGGTKKRRKSSSPEGIDDETKSIDSSSTSMTGKVENLRLLMPWKPNRKVLPDRCKNSSLSFEEHKRYIGIIANRLKANVNYRFEHNRHEILAFDKKLEEDRKLYEKTALLSAKQFKSRLLNYNRNTSEVFLQIWEEKIKTYIGKHTFQGSILSIPWENESSNEQCISMPLRVSKVLSPGEAKNVIIPDIQKRIFLKSNTVRNAIQSHFKQKKLITNDPLAQEYALTNDVPFLMDASTLRHFLCSAWSRRLHISACRLSVIRRVHTGAIRNLYILSPPVIASRIHKSAVTQTFAKWTVKSNLLYGTETKENGQPEKKRSRKEDSCDSLSLLDELGLGHIGTVASEKSKHRYSIVNLGDSKKEMEEKPEHQILVRTTLHGVDKSNNSMPISITARAEFLPEVAAEKLTVEEMIWNIATGLLKGSQEHINFRVAVTIGRRGREEVDVLQYDRRSSTDLNKIDTEIRQMLGTRIKRFCSLMNAISQSELDVGEYLVIPTPDGEQMQIVEERKQTDEEMDDNYNQMDESFEKKTDVPSRGIVYDSNWFDHFLKSKIISPQDDVDAYWEGIDPHYPLQWHVVRGQIPGALYPTKQPKKS